MTIHFDSWQTLIAVLLGAGTLLSILGSLHWRLVIAPQLKKILIPYGESLDMVSHVVKAKFPQEYRDAMNDVRDGRALRQAI